MNAEELERQRSTIELVQRRLELAEELITANTRAIRRLTDFMQESESRFFDSVRQQTEQLKQQQVQLEDIIVKLRELLHQHIKNCPGHENAT